MNMVRGWCPDLAHPMASGDGLLLRVRPTLARLDADAAIRLAQAARRHGNGIVEVTNRGNLQFRGFTAASAERFQAEAVAAGMADTGVPLLVSPLAGLDPLCAPDTLAIAAALHAGLRTLDAALLPAKFGLLVDGGGVLPLAACSASIALRHGPDGWRIEQGGQSQAAVPGAEAAQALGLVQAGANHAVVAASAMPPPVAVGTLGSGWFGVGTLPGRFDCGSLKMLAELSLRLGDGMLRITPWRAILLCGLNPGAMAALPGLLSGHVIEADDPRLRVACCIGAPGCCHATVPAADDALRLSASLDTLLPSGGTLHVSGCAKGCGHPGPATLTLVGRDGRYDLVRDGRAGDVPLETGLMP